MQQYLKKALIASFIIFFSVSAHSQYKKRNIFLDGVSVQPKIGVNMFYGDLVTKKRTNYTLGVSGEKEIRTYISGRVDLNFGSMKGTQLLPATDLTYAYFKNTYFHLNAGASFYPLNLAYGYFKQRLFNPYVIGQFGGMYFNTTEYWGNGSPYEEGTEWRSVNSITPTISGGVGLSYYINNRMRVSGEWIGSFIFSDKVDGHDVWYTEGLTGTRHVTDGNDFFYAGTIGLIYIIQDNQWKNNPKYNRKAYLRKRSNYKLGGSSKKKRRKSSSGRSRSKRYRR